MVPLYINVNNLVETLLTFFFILLLKLSQEIFYSNFNELLIFTHFNIVWHKVTGVEHLDRIIFSAIIILNFVLYGSSLQILKIKYKITVKNFQIKSSSHSKRTQNIYSAWLSLVQGNNSGTFSEEFIHYSSNKFLRLTQKLLLYSNVLYLIILV